MEDNDDDFFSDDGFDDLPPGTLLQLEQSAFQATQAQNLAPSQPPLTQLDTPAANYRARFPQKPSVGQARQALPAQASLQPPPRLHTGLTNDYGDLDVGELDAEVLNNENDTTIPFDQPVVFEAQSDHPQNVLAPADDSGEFDDALPDLMEVDMGQSHIAALQENSNIVAEKVNHVSYRLLVTRLIILSGETARARK